MIEISTGVSRSRYGFATLFMGNHRIDRMQFLVAVCWPFGISVFSAAIALQAISAADANFGLLAFVGAIAICFDIMVSMMLWQAMKARLHDLGLSAWWLAMPTAVIAAITAVVGVGSPIATMSGVGVIWAVGGVLLAVPGKNQDNRFGPPPV
jgi:uncharacterized membrane protein YhaH (DUF805 family)